MLLIAEVFWNHDNFWWPNGIRYFHTEITGVSVTQLSDGAFVYVHIVLIRDGWSEVLGMDKAYGSTA